MSKKRSPALGARVPQLSLLTVDSPEADAIGGATLMILKFAVFFVCVKFCDQIFVFIFVL